MVLPAMAGMASPLPLDVAKSLRLTGPSEMRLEAISLFVAALLISPLVVRWLWNSVARDFPRMPRITYGKSLALVVIWGLLFLVVLTMIAGTRELMTPGTWQKQGLLYTLPASQCRPRRNRQRRGAEAVKFRIGCLVALIGADGPRGGDILRDRPHPTLRVDCFPGPNDPPGNRQSLRRGERRRNACCCLWPWSTTSAAGSSAPRPPSPAFCRGSGDSAGPSRSSAP